MLDAASGDDRDDAVSADQATVLVVVVASIGVEPAKSTTRLADHALNRRDGVDQRDQWGDVVAVSTGHGDGERDAGGVGNRMVIGAGLASVDRVRPGVVPL